jgi:ATP-dependent DNA helicase RecG
MEGTQQSGLPFELKIASLAQDGKMLEIARNTAIKVLEDDPQLQKIENRILSVQLQKMSTNSLNWGFIS